MFRQLTNTATSRDAVLHTHVETQAQARVTSTWDSSDSVLHTSGGSAHVEELWRAARHHMQRRGSRTSPRTRDTALGGWRSGVRAVGGDDVVYCKAAAATAAEVEAAGGPLCLLSPLNALLSTTTGTSTSTTTGITTGARTRTSTALGLRSEDEEEPDTPLRHPQASKEPYGNACMPLWC